MAVVENFVRCQVTLEGEIQTFDIIPVFRGGAYRISTSPP